MKIGIINRLLQMFFTHLAQLESMPQSVYTHKGSILKGSMELYEPNSC